MSEEQPKVVKNASAAEDPGEVAAQMLYMYTPKFNDAVDKLSSNALRRVLKKLVSFPLNEKAYKATSTGENEVFMVGDRLLEAKFLLIMEQHHKTIQTYLDTEEQNNAEEAKEVKDV